MNVHVVIRSVAVALGIGVSVYVTIPDYGWEYSLFYNLAYDPTGWLHELAYIWALVLGIVAVDAWYEWTQTLKAALNAYLGFNGSPPVLEKVKRFRKLRICRRDPRRDRPS